MPRTMAKRSKETDMTPAFKLSKLCCVISKWRSLTALLLQGDSGDGPELSLHRVTVGQVEVEAVRHQQLVLGGLVLPAAHQLVRVAHHLHYDGRVSVLALRLAHVDKLQDGFELLGQVHNPGHGGGGLHAPGPARGG